MASKFEILDSTTLVSEQVETTAAKSSSMDFVTKVADSASPLTKVNKSLSNATNLSEGLAIAKKLGDSSTELGALNEKYGKLLKTPLSSLTDLTDMDFSEVMDLDGVDWEALDLPDFKALGIDPSTIVDLTGIDISSFAMPLMNLTGMNGDCPSMGLDFDMSSINMKGWDLPSFDFPSMPDFGFGGKDGVAWGDMFNLGSVDMSGMFDFAKFDLSGLDLPDWDLGKMPSFPGFDGFGDFDGIDTSWFGQAIDKIPDLGLGNIFKKMGSAGDLFGLGSLGGALSGVGCIGKGLVDALYPDSVINAFKNFDMPELGIDVPTGLLDGFSLDDFSLSDFRKKLGTTLNGLPLDKLKDFGIDIPSFDIGGISLGSGNLKGVKDAVASVLPYVGEPWWWDKEQGIYDWDFLKIMKANILDIMQEYPQYEEVVCNARACQLHTQALWLADRKRSKLTKANRSINHYIF